VRILIVKMSSLGDVVHMLPAITDAAAHFSNLTVDWVVEEGFAAIPTAHPAVRRVIPIALRRWRKSLLSGDTWREIKHFSDEIRADRYDWILDTQGLIKSAAVDFLAHGRRGGHAFTSAREPLAALVLHQQVHAPRELHAIFRNRMLTAAILGYELKQDASPHYGLALPSATEGIALPPRYLLALHGTARTEKEYPIAQWKTLIRTIHAAGWPVLLPWGSALEQGRAEILAEAGGQVLPRLDLSQLASIIAASSGVVGVDTGLMHLAAALRKPGVGLYPATDPVRFGVLPEADAPPIHNLYKAEDLIPEIVATKLLGSLTGDLLRIV
jgi:heptosyltransferase-1